jgi:hypothetical protein
MNRESLRVGWKKMWTQIIYIPSIITGVEDGD